jgi:uncharacterized protein YbcV (DUF1398 family)
MTPGTPSLSGTVEVPPFDRDALITALRIDQAGESTFARFLEASWRAGVVRYEVDFSARTVSYYGVLAERSVRKRIHSLRFSSIANKIGNNRLPLVQHGSG